MSISDKINVFIEKTLGIMEDNKRRVNGHEFEIKLQENKDDLIFRVYKFSWIIELGLVAFMLLLIYDYVTFRNSDESGSIWSLICVLYLFYEIVHIQILKTKKVVFSKKTNTFKLLPVIYFDTKVKSLDLIKNICIEKSVVTILPKIDEIRYKVKLEYGNKRKLYNISTHKTYEDAKNIGTIIADYLNLELKDYVK